jgi:hypothetical protein
MKRYSEEEKELHLSDAEAIVDVLSLVENLKTEMRHSWL